MAEKKTATKKVATTEKATTKKAAAKKTVATKVVKAEKAEEVEKVAEVKATPAKKCGAKKAVKSELYINSESVGFRAGDVYQSLAAAGKSLTVAEIAKAANISTEEVLLGLGWLFKEGKIVGENVADIRLA